MRADSAELLSIEGQPVRVTRWRGSRSTAALAPLGESGSFDAHGVHQLLSVLRQYRYTEAITSALPEHEVSAFLDAGFEIKERLWLLAHPIRPVVKPSFALTQRARKSDRPKVLELDGKAFDPFWRLDDASLLDALQATPRSRFRVIRPRGKAQRKDLPALIGYAIFGLAGTRGYLQRLAVDPACRNRGSATGLVQDGLFWLSRRGVSVAYVNTQVGNTTALSLYQRLGFELQPSGLVVLSANFGSQW